MSGGLLAEVTSSVSGGLQFASARPTRTADTGLQFWKSLMLCWAPPLRLDSGEYTTGRSPRRMYCRNTHRLHVTLTLTRPVRHALVRGQGPAECSEFGIRAI